VSRADAERRPGVERAHARLVAGQIVPRERGPGEILGLVLGVPSLAATRTALEKRLLRNDGGVAWLDSDEAFGLRLGFAKLEGDMRIREA
jgi:hypothetical protein